MREEILAVFSPRHPHESKAEIASLREARAELVSLGGAVLLAVCLVMGAVLVMAFMLPEVTQAQRAIAFILFAASWLYLLDSVTEKLWLRDGLVQYKSLMSSSKSYELAELEAVYLVHQGFNLEKGFESIIFRRSGNKPERIALGPCWQRNKLERFMHGIEEALREPHLLEEIR